MPEGRARRNLTASQPRPRFGLKAPCGQTHGARLLIKTSQLSRRRLPKGMPKLPTDQFLREDLERFLIRNMFGRYMSK